MDTTYTITLTLSESFIYNLNNKVFYLISYNFKVFNKIELVFDKQPDSYILPAAAAIFKYK